MYPQKMDEQMSSIITRYDQYKYFLTPVRHESVLTDKEVVYEHATLITALPAVLDVKDPDYQFMEGLITGNAEVLIEEELEKVL
jgi:hypothetical protein